MSFIHSLYLKERPKGVTNCLCVPGPGSGWSRTGSTSGYSASGRGSAGPGTGYWSGAGDRDRWGKIFAKTGKMKNILPVSTVGGTRRTPSLTSSPSRGWTAETWCTRQRRRQPRWRWHVFTILYYNCQCFSLSVNTWWGTC